MTIITYESKDTDRDYNITDELATQLMTKLGLQDESYSAFYSRIHIMTEDIGKVISAFDHMPIYWIADISRYFYSDGIRRGVAMHLYDIPAKLEDWCNE